MEEGTKIALGIVVYIALLIAFVALPHFIAG